MAEEGACVWQALAAAEQKQAADKLALDRKSKLLCGMRFG